MSSKEEMESSVQVDGLVLDGERHSSSLVTRKRAEHKGWDLEVLFCFSFTVREDSRPTAESEFGIIIGSINRQAMMI